MNHVQNIWYAFLPSPPAASRHVPCTNPRPDLQEHDYRCPLLLYVLGFLLLNPSSSRMRFYTWQPCGQAEVVTGVSNTFRYPGTHVSVFIAHTVQNSYCSSIFIKKLPTYNARASEIEQGDFTGVQTPERQPARVAQQSIG